MSADRVKQSLHSEQVQARSIASVHSTILMVFADVTTTFRDLLAAQEVEYPPTRSKSPFRSKSPNRKGKGKQVEEDEEFLKEAYRIVSYTQL